MKLLTKCTTLMLAAFLAGCSEETQHAGGNQPEPGGTDDAGRREVLLTLKNKLALKPVATKAETIATADENAIETLDVYVFASESEAGDNYTLLQRFAYRAEAEATLPAGAEELQLAVDGDNDETTTGLLKVKKGLFVKLYCIANNTMLVDPASGDGTPLTDAAFTPLVLSEADGNNPAKIVAPGQPSESIFKTYHTALLSATVPGDTLCTPLAMSGAQTTPLDLTDLGSSARVQTGFKLTRLAARFDIVNNAETSRFTIQSISMGNSRRGATFFPIRIYGTVPEAATGELITCPSRTFSGEKANKGMQTGAFYSYPSPKNDHGFLTLKGLYRINKTESKEVSYQIPFTQQAADGSSSFLEINNNHRYTIGITEADDYHLDFTLTVADWADDGNIDEYKPEDGSGELDVAIPPTFTDETVYDPDTRTINMSVKNGSSIDINIKTNSALNIQKTYAGGPESQQYDWLEISEPSITNTTKATIPVCTYQFTIKENYDKPRFPRVVVRFTNTMNGAETVLFVEAVTSPLLNDIQQAPGNCNTLDVKQQKATMYKVVDSKINVSITCPDGIVIKSKPDWLEIKNTETTLLKNAYELTIKEESLNTGIGDSEGSVVFQNNRISDLTTAITINLLSSEITANNEVSLQAATSGNTAISVHSSAIGVKASVKDWGGGDPWFNITTPEIKGDGSILITQISTNTSSVMKPATILLTNKIPNGENKEIKVIPTGFTAPKLSSTSGTLANIKNENSTSVDVTVTPPAGGFVYTIDNSNIASISQNGNRLTFTAKYTGSTTIRVKNKSDESKTATYSINVSRDYKGQYVWKYSGYYIAPVNADESCQWNSNLSSKCPSGWRVPTHTEWFKIVGVNSTFPTTNTGSRYQELKNNKVFNTAHTHWSSNEYNESLAYYMFVGSSSGAVGYDPKTDRRQVRCIKQ